MKLQRLSLKNTVCLVVISLPLACFIIFVTSTIFSIQDSMDIIAAVKSRRESRNKTKLVLLLSHKMSLDNHLTECPSMINCIVTENKGLFGGDLSFFDALVFDETHLYTRKKWAHQRTKTQLYIFTSIESPKYYPACELRYDDFFNWTFTYKLDSDLHWKFFVVKDQSGDIIAPSKHVQWKESNETVPAKVKSVINGRTKAAAWMVSNCHSVARNNYLTSLKEYLYAYSLQIDVFGGCTKRKCEGDCNEMLRKNYFFYMAFENSFADDYVTEKVLHGYDNYVVPIVFGGANYSRFLPPGSYIDAQKLHPYNLAHLINLAMTRPKVYESYFKWINLYTIDSNYSNFHPACELCKALISEKAKHAPANKKFRFWWNTSNGMKWCLPKELLMLLEGLVQYD